MPLFRLVKHVGRWLACKISPVEYARKIGVEIGDDCRILGMEAGTFGSEPFLVKIGSHVTITSGVRFVTHDGGVWVFRHEYPDIEVFGKIEVGSNTFIGINTIILPGVRIGNDCIIGAGSIVSKDIPDGSVAAGVPARVVSSIEDYKQKVLQKATYIRSYMPERKKEFLAEFLTQTKKESGA